MTQTVADIKSRLQRSNEREFSVLERSLRADTRKGVVQALEVARKRLGAEKEEQERLASLYSFEKDILVSRGATCAVGLDEVGRGPLAGPLAVGAVVLPQDSHIEKLNDSKQVKHTDRVLMAQRIKQESIAWAVEFIEPDYIDAHGMTNSLIKAFALALARIEEQGVTPEVVLLDGNPLRMDSREVNVIKGDSKCASIAAASIIAKVERDELMARYAQEYPDYGFESCKGYASAAHIEAIKRFGLTPIHRVSFCSAFTQPSLF